MIFENDKMMYRNVFSMKFVSSISDIKEHIDTFIKILKIHDVIPSNGIFYTINDIKSEDEIYFEVFQPAEDYVDFQDSKIMFRTYYVHDYMLSTYIFDDFEKIEWSYGELILQTKEKNRIPLSNIYNELHQMGDKYYIIVKIAIGEVEETF